MHERDLAVIYLCPFFLQAEDVIRDADVTGVQTCALPISGDPTIGQSSGSARLDEAGLKGAKAGSGRYKRSEERRVGEEGRSRWSPYHLKKKKRIHIRSRQYEARSDIIDE